MTTVPDDATDPVPDRIADARTAVRRERRRVEDERAAFDAFVDRLDDLAVRTHVRQQLPGRTLTDVPDAGTEAVRRAYRETVMGVPHYEREYDESLHESIEAELGAEVAGALSGTLGPAGKRALVRSATEARDARSRFLDTLDREARVLDETGTTLRAIEHALPDAPDGSFDDLVALRADLAELREECDAVAERRQRAIHASVPGSDADLAVYLYDAYPVLATVADLATRIECALRATDRAIAHAR